VIPYHEIRHDFEGSLNMSIHWTLNTGTHTYTEGVVSAYAGGDQVISLVFYPQPGMVIRRIGLEYLAASGAEGHFYIHQYREELIGSYSEQMYSALVVGPEETTIETSLGFEYSDSDRIVVSYLHEGADSGEIVTIRKINLLCEGYPNAKKTGWDTLTFRHDEPTRAFEDL